MLKTILFRKIAKPLNISHTYFILLTKIQQFLWRYQLYPSAMTILVPLTVKETDITSWTKESHVLFCFLSTRRFYKWHFSVWQVFILVQEIMELNKKNSQPSLARNALEELILLLRSLYREFVLRRSTCVESAWSDFQKYYVPVSLRSFSSK